MELELCSSLFIPLLELYTLLGLCDLNKSSYYDRKQETVYKFNVPRLFSLYKIQTNVNKIMIKIVNV